MSYNNKGLYNRYKKNHAERAALDFYATPPEEVKNIINILGVNRFENKTILENSCGQGHIVEPFLEAVPMVKTIIATDIQDRGYSTSNDKVQTYFGEEYDYLGDNYPFQSADFIIMNPPYATIEPFVIRSLEIAKEGILLLGRLQFLEGKGRYDSILKDNPPSDVYIYVDRIKCYKNGDFSQKESSAQAYAWFYWDIKNYNKISVLHWIRRISST